jgi:hypothetical protein
MTVCLAILSLSSAFSIFFKIHRPFSDYADFAAKMPLAAS